MKLKNWLKYIDPIFTVAIWTSDNTDEHEPDFKGSAYNIPWWMADCKIGFKDNDILHDAPILISQENGKPLIIINIISE